MEPASSSDSENESEPEEIKGIEEEESTSDEYSSSNDETDDLSEHEDVADEDTKVKKLWNTEDPNTSLEDLMKLRDRLGTKKFDREVKESLMKPNKVKRDRKDLKANFKRENKNRPQEISSKIRVNKLQQVVPKSKFIVRDPRFDDLCGSEFKEEIFNKSYAFLDDIKNRETKELTRQLHKCKSGASKKKLKYLLNRMQQQETTKKMRADKRARERLWKKEEWKKVEQGVKKPYFLKKSDRNRLHMEERKKQLEKSGTLKKVEANRDKKLKSKESKIMPYGRRKVES